MMPQSKKPAPSRLDAMAKQSGFPSYAAMKAWNDKYRKPVQSTTPATKPPSKVRNFFQTIRDTIPIHFAEKRVTSALSGAQKKKKKP
jgi:hypothetical protein